jgi:hypothetical protein
MLNNQAEMLAAFGRAHRAAADRSRAMFRLAKYQELQVSPDAAEETLLSARRLQPTEIKTFQNLAQFYARRAGVMHANAQKQDVQEQTVPGSPDKNGVYQVGGGITAPRRFGTAVYPVEAMAADIDGVVTAEITVNEQGIVADARRPQIQPCAGRGPRSKAVREWRYDPTMVDGKAVPVKMTVTVSFSLRK